MLRVEQRVESVDAAGMSKGTRLTLEVPDERIGLRGALVLTQLLELSRGAAHLAPQERSHGSVCRALDYEKRVLSTCMCVRGAKPPAKEACHLSLGFPEATETSKP